MTTEDAGKERLQKILARAGFGSRRACEELIVEGRVSINDQTVSVLGVRADPQRDVITVDGERVHLPRPAYWILNKKEGSSFNDAEAESELQSLVEGDYGRLFTAGRLDRMARGLMLITNDGRAANVLTHPRYRVPKVYRVTVKGMVDATAARNIERALFYAMNNGRFEPIDVARASGGKTPLTLTVYEGLPQALRDICLKFGHGVKSIERVRLGPIELGSAPGGALRKLRAEEIQMLLKYVDEAESGRLDYEKPLVTPARFQRDEEATGFRRKKTGARGTTTVGQKKTRARVQGRGKPFGRPERGERGERGPRRESGPRGERGPRRDGGPRGERGPRREGGPRGERGPRREGGPRGPRPGGRGPRRDGGKPPRRRDD